MLRRSLVACAALSAALLSAPVLAQTVGQSAPALALKDSAGKLVNLADFRGKTVVLEWVNPSCPFVKKHYGAGHMQATQKAAAGDGVVWLTVSSTHPGHADYKQPTELASWMQQQGSGASALLMDDDGKVGKAWGARTTPHLYVVNPAGTLVYAGAIDSKPSANPADIAAATNYVRQALGELKAGQAVSKPSSTPYGCSIKYS
jgi:peroxiredoxin